MRSYRTIGPFSKRQSERHVWIDNSDTFFFLEWNRFFVTIPRDPLTWPFYLCQKFNWSEAWRFHSVDKVVFCRGSCGMECCAGWKTFLSSAPLWPASHSDELQQPWQIMLAGVKVWARGWARSWVCIAVPAQTFPMPLLFSEMFTLCICRCSRVGKLGFDKEKWSRESGPTLCFVLFIPLLWQFNYNEK